VLDRTADNVDRRTAGSVASGGVGVRAFAGGIAAFLAVAAAETISRLERGIDAFARARTGTGSFFGRAWHVLRTDGVASLPRHIWHFFVAQSFSSLTRRIVFLNVAGLLAFVLGILYLTQFRAGLIEARVQSLIVQGEIIAGAVAAQATVDTDSISIDPDRLLELQAGESYGPSDDVLFGDEFPVNPERVAPLLRRLIMPTKTRARIYDRDGILIMDSRNLYGRGDVLRFDLPPPNTDKPGFLERTFIAVRTWLGRGDLPPYHDLGGDNGKGYPEVNKSLNGQKASMVRINDRGEVIVLVAVPIQRFRTVRGALLLSTQGAEIDQTVAAERLAGTIAGPVRRLADGADRVRRRVKGRVEIPDFTTRRDEIGHLSGNLREMTDALYNRIEAIESFAADVAHELKNPLTSLRSAVETLPLAKTDTSRARLLTVIQDDVRRLDRLISDISDASRLDAELQRQDSAPVDLSRLLSAVVTIANEVKRNNDVTVTLAFEGSPRIYLVQGYDSRLSQVINNLIDNARSFSPAGGVVRVTCRRTGDEIAIIVEDDGPGIQPDALEKIFERFYTDRPQQSFGQNSGLGLSISKQIVEAHGGRLTACNRAAPPEEDGELAVMGACFTVHLRVL
jgi:two-component system, OmpR family, sensor histidine kinase ChvG